MKGGSARFERWPTIVKRREFVVGQRDETSLVPPDILLRFIRASALLGYRGYLTLTSFMMRPETFQSCT